MINLSTPSHCNINVNYDFLLLMIDKQDMASAPPMETGGFVGLPQPPSYEESVGPQYQGAVLPPAYTKSAQYPYPTQPYSQIYQPTAHSTTSPIGK